MAEHRQPSVPGLPTGTVTFLFTDIEGSTTLWEQHPLAMRRALGRHDTLIRNTISAHGGQVFKSTGDGLCAAFAVATDAVVAAVAAQQLLLVEPWQEIGCLKARMALHAGLGELQDGDYVGQPLNRVARLLATAHGGQIVASQAATDLARDTLPAGLSFADLGEHHLRDLTRPERVHQVLAPSLPRAFPPLRSLDTLPNNLPRQPTRFVGREQVLLSLRARLLRDDVHLLTLTGPGGTGKTRLALQLAADLLDSFPDGVYFVPLAQIADPDLVLPAIARTLDVKEESNRPLLASLVTSLQTRALLLLIDNFEHVLSAALALAELMAACPRLKLVVTSRAALNLYGEHQAPVPPLVVPDARALLTAQHAGLFESVRLFLDRAQAARPDFVIDDQNAATVVEICRQLDGLPLAIELAAARLRALPLPALRDRMGRRLPLLTGGPRDVPARQQTLRGAIAWSYDLLDEAEQTLFRRLAVFHGCTLVAIEAVCRVGGGQPSTTATAVVALDLDPLDAATSLVEKSLLRQEMSEDGQPWYVMLQTVRELALEQLAESAEADVIRRRHVAYYLRFAEQAEPELSGPNQRSWLARLEREHDNLRAAVRLCQTGGYAEPAFRLGVSLWWFWAIHGHIGEGRQILSGLLDRFRPRDAAHRLVALRARTLQAAGYLAGCQNDHKTARASHEESLQLFRELDDMVGVESALGALGQVATVVGDLEAARAFVEETRYLAQERGDPLAIAGALASLAHILHDQRDFAGARSMIEMGIAVKRQIATPREVALLIHNLSVILEEQGDYPAARELYEQSLAGLRDSGDRRGIALVLAKLGSVMAMLDEYDAARDALRESLAIHEELGDPSGIALALEGFATLAAAQTQPSRALRLAGAAAALRASVATPLPAAAVAALDRKLLSARRVLGEADASAAMEAGAQLTMDETMAEALADPAQEVVLEGDPETNPEPRPTRRNSGRSGGGVRRMKGAECACVTTTDPAPLSVREREVATFVARGRTNRQIAAELVITEGTVANHIVHILDRLGVNTRAEIAVWASEHGLLG